MLKERGFSMKKFLISLLCALLCLLLGAPCIASAEGLDGLSGGLPNISAPVSGDPGVLPDPADLLGEKGTLFAVDYNFSASFTCSVYTYPLADESFFNGYLEQAKANGFTVSNTTVEGYTAYRLEYEDLAALLLPDYDGVMMLLAQNGIVFGEPLPEYYLRMVYNGREILTGKLEFMRSDGAHQYKFEYFDPNQSPDHFVMRFPKSMRTGDDITWTPDSPPDYLYLYSGDALLMHYLSFTGSGEWGGSNDFFRLKIVSKEETPQGLIIEAQFSAVLDYASITIENGAFRILIK